MNGAHSTLAYALAFCRLATLFIFAVSSVSKARDLSSFRKSLSRFRVLPEPMIGVAVVLVLIAEVSTALLLAWGGSWLTIGFGAASALLLAFSAAIASVLVRRLQTPCNCFGGGRTRDVSAVDLWRNAMLLLLASGGCALAVRGSASWATPLGVAEWGLLGLMAAFVAASLMNLSELVDLFTNEAPA